MSNLLKRILHSASPLPTPSQLSLSPFPTPSASISPSHSDSPSPSPSMEEEEIIDEDEVNHKIAEREETYQNIWCTWCHGHTKDDIRGNCIACGASRQ